MREQRSSSKLSSDEAIARKPRLNAIAKMPRSHSHVGSIICVKARVIVLINLLSVSVSYTVMDVDITFLIAIKLLTYFEEIARLDFQGSIVSRIYNNDFNYKSFGYIWDGIIKITIKLDIYMERKLESCTIEIVLYKLNVRINDDCALRKNN